MSLHNGIPGESQPKSDEAQRDPQIGNDRDPAEGNVSARPNHAAILTECRLLCATAETAMRAAGHSAGKLICRALANDARRSPVRHFPVSPASAENMAAWVVEKAQSGFDVYRALVIYRPDLPAGEHGKAIDALGAFGLCADLDTDLKPGIPARLRPEDLPLAPTLVTATSMHAGGTNYHASYLFNELLPMADARVLARGLCQCVADANGATADAVHIWRFAGTLNYPNAKKLKRGRAPEPQLVLAEPAGTGQPVAPEALRDALEVAGIDFAAFAAIDDVEASNGAAYVAVEPANRDHWNGDPRELERIADALQFIDSDPGDAWALIRACLHHNTRGDDAGYDLWTAWSRGAKSPRRNPKAHCRWPGRW